MTDQLVIRDLEVSIAGKQDPEGPVPDRGPGRGPRPDGPERVGQDEPGLRADGPPGLPRRRRRHHLGGREPAVRPNAAGMSPDKRARLGLFLAFQYPSAIPGVTVASFLRNIYNAVHHPQAGGRGAAQQSIKYTGIPLAKFRKLIEEKMALLHMDPAFATRYVNDGFSGGEKKRLEMLQMAILVTEDGDPRRDRLRPRHRRAAQRGGRHQRHPLAGDGGADDHPLPADAELREARPVRARPARRAGRHVRRRGALAPARGQRLRLGARRRSACPARATRRRGCRRSPPSRPSRTGARRSRTDGRPRRASPVDDPRRLQRHRAARRLPGLRAPDRHRQAARLPGLGRRPPPSRGS